MTVAYSKVYPKISELVVQIRLLNLHPTRSKSPVPKDRKMLKTFLDEAILSNTDFTFGT